MSDEKSEKELRVVLELDVFDKLERIKNFHGIKNMTELIRYLITKEERKIRKEKLSED